MAKEQKSSKPKTVRLLLLVDASIGWEEYPPQLREFQSTEDAIQFANKIGAVHYRIINEEAENE